MPTTRTLDLSAVPCLAGTLRGGKVAEYRFHRPGLPLIHRVAAGDDGTPLEVREVASLRRPGSVYGLIPSADGASFVAVRMSRFTIYRGRNGGSPWGAWDAGSGGDFLESAKRLGLLHVRPYAPWA